uniref:Interleukin family protein n=1 Tax=Cynoglossus semilaevis TaxID=244447 RepID=A0A3P8V1L0_CYNSE
MSPPNILTIVLHSLLSNVSVIRHVLHCSVACETRTYTDVFTRLHQEGQMCCFMHLLMRFYIERVFSSYTSPQPINQRCSSALANAFVTIKRDIHKCHCHCGEETHRKIDSIHAEFTKLQVDTAARKAMGELNVVLEWLEGLGQNPAS